MEIIESLDHPDTLVTLIAVSGVSGDEGHIAAHVDGLLQGIPGVTIQHLGDNLLVTKGTPRTALFAHMDTVGWTLGYNHSLIPVGSPHGKDGDELRSENSQTGRLRIRNNKPELRRIRDKDGKKSEAAPGTRWVYARPTEIENGVVTSPYMDDRAGVWCALRALARCENIAVAFCTGEEQHGHGARVCGEWLYRNHNITQALIADITWHTDDTPRGKGVVISLRDAYCPRQVFLERILTLAEESGVLYQREIQSYGSSDGGHLLRSTLPIDWVFIGAPEEHPHTARERANLSDFDAMTNLLVYLTNHL